MKTAEEIMNKHFKECFETHNEKVSEKYILYFHKAMNEFSKQESENAVREFKERLINDSDDYVEVFTLLRNVKYQTEREETQEYKMCFEMEVPKIIKGYLIEKLK